MITREFKMMATALFFIPFSTVQLIFITLKLADVPFLSGVSWVIIVSPTAGILLISLLILTAALVMSVVND